MDVGRVRLERLRCVELLKEFAAAKLAHAHVNGDAGAHVTGGLEGFQRQLGRPRRAAMYSVKS